MDATIKQKIVKEVCELLGIDQTTDTAKVKRVESIVELVNAKILSRTRQETLIPTLIPLAIEMVIAVFQTTQSADQDGTTPTGTISSISDNGQTVSFSQSQSQALQQAVSKKVFEFDSYLDRWTKAGW